MIDPEVINAMLRRLDTLEMWKHEQHTKNALYDQDRTHIDKRFDKIEEDLQEINDVAKKLIGVIVVAILSAFLAFMFKGGLNV